MAESLAYTVTSSKPFAEAVAAVQDAAVRAGFKVQHIHDVAKSLADKGLSSEPYSIIEV